MTSPDLDTNIKENPRYSFTDSCKEINLQKYIIQLCYATNAHKYTDLTI